VCFADSQIKSIDYNGARTAKDMLTFALDKAKVRMGSVNLPSGT
jgi:hypothetical protein